MADRKTLLMIEDEPLLCDLFAEYIKTIPEVEFLGDERDGSMAMKRSLELKPDIIVLDIRLPEVNGLEILTLLHRKLPETAVIIFTGSLSEETLRITLSNGALGYVEKSYGLEELHKAINAAMKGEKHYSPGVQQLMRNYRF
ncbi:MAG: response regulator transcription factor [Opitutales bacterium]|nr:response regulator transcription factor [Opitutales bacterium]